MLLLSIGLTAQDLPLLRIRDQGLQRSQVMNYAHELIDGIGARLTGSPGLKRAEDWSQRTFMRMGLSNVRSESWGPFGMGWRQRNVWARIVEPNIAMLQVQAGPWSPATKGAVRGDAIAFDPSRRDFFKGKLKGAVVLLGSASPGASFKVHRWTEAELVEFARDITPSPGEDIGPRIAKHWDTLEEIGRFLASEGAAAVIVPSSKSTALANDTNHTFGWYVYQTRHAMKTPLLIASVDDYGRLTRLVSNGQSVSIELNVDTEFMGEQEGRNIFADLPGSSDELVLLSAHLDSWHAGTGATDDAAGVVIAMEAMRILKAVGAQPKRTIRIALWTGEEQGGLGSRAWVRQHVAEVPYSEGPAPEFLRRVAGAPKPKELFSKISAAITLDAGGGKIRGVSLSHNRALGPIFQEWAKPLKDLGFEFVSMQSDCGGDCAAFEHAGIPTPSFKQDPLDYESRTQHTDADTYERLILEDLKQAAVVVATFVYHIATHDELLPRATVSPR